MKKKHFTFQKKYSIDLTKVHTFPYIIKSNQIRFIQFGGHRDSAQRAPPPYSPFHHLSYHIYQYYCYNMLLFHRVVIGHYQYHSTDTRNTSLGRILQKISCVTRRSVILGRGPKDLLYLLDTQYTILT